MKKEELDIFEKLFGQTESLYNEISSLSKKNPNDALNKFKLSLINKIISQCNEYLGESYVPFKDFVVFDEDSIPTNSDVVMILSQYLESFEKLKADNVITQHGFWYWRLIGGKGEKKDKDGFVFERTTSPKQMKEKK